MAHTPKPVRKAIKSAQKKYSDENKKHPMGRFLGGIKGAKKAAKNSIKHMASEGHVSRKGKIPSHMRTGMHEVAKKPGKYKK